MIVIPMAGLSRRFTDAGYTVPKYMLPLRTETVFDHAVSSFRDYFNTHRFLFIARDVNQTRSFLGERASALGIANYDVVMLDEQTDGQAATVALGIEQSQAAIDGPATVFNIDTFRPGFRYPEAEWFERSDGYLEVFEGSGANWSYVKSAGTDAPVVLETAEKKPISNLCCTGLYHFNRASDLIDALALERSNPTSQELYIAPLYNHLIGQGRSIHYNLIKPDQVIFCGVPAEYQALL